MTVYIGGYSFDGPYDTPGKFESVAGVFVVHTGEGDGAVVVDVDEGEDVREAVEAHPRMSCWQQHVHGPARFSVLYTWQFSKEERLYVVRDVRKVYTPPCGENPATPVVTGKEGGGE
ncbi:MAG: hypothetical protein ACREJQ_08920 [bacterium]